MHQAALMSRQRGRIVLVGVAGLELSRDDFFKKELTFQVSSSYGPGRYDPRYEEQGNDYPFGFVRWTEQRNFEAVLDMLADGRLEVESMVSHRFPIEAAAQAYALISSPEPSLGIVLDYPARGGIAEARTVVSPAAAGTRPPGDPAVGVSVIGSGQFATAVLIPAFRDAGATLRAVASSGGVSGLHAARKFGFARSTTDTASLFSDAATSAIVITTRHNSHARFALEAARADKHVFVEKPLCLRLDELGEIATAFAAPSAPILMVGFNRRFAPLVQTMRRLLAATTGPKVVQMTVNAGAIPAEHWTQDPAIGGGRIVGEACHFVDLLRCVVDASIVDAGITRMASATGDTAQMHFSFADGSIGSVHYLANGSKRFPKERLEVFAGGRVLQLDNFRRLNAFGFPGFTSERLWRQDKGHAACAAAFVSAVRTGGASPIALDEILEVSRVTIALAAQ
jgi:predicted dehydrogenase